MQNSPITLHDVLMGEAAIEDAIYQVVGGLEAVPSGLSLESYRKADPTRLRSVIQHLEKLYDYVLVDAPAGIETNVLASLTSTQQTIIVTAPNPPSIADAIKTKQVAQKLQAHPVGFIVNFVRGEKGEIKRDEIARILELPPYGEIPFDDNARTAFLAKEPKPLVLTKPNAPAAKAIQVTADKMTGKKVEIKTIQKEGFLTKILKMLFGKKKKEK
jgi:septum site-determining protein MinD